MSKLLLILLRMANSNQTRMYKLWSMVVMVDDHIRIYMTDLNDEDYIPPAAELEDDEYEEGHGDYEPPEYLSDNEYVYDNEDEIPYRDNN